MTFEEYYNKYRSGLLVSMSYEEIIGANWCDRFIFPSLEEHNVYLPFTYASGNIDGLHGGEFAKLVSSRIFNNFRNMEVVELITRVTDSYNPLHNRVFNLMEEHRYKWGALYESTLVDGDYDILDNVNEITTETTTRTPDLTHTHTEGFQEGSQTITNTTNYGSRLIQEDTEGKNKTYPYDDDTTAHNRDSAEGSVTHSETNHTDSNTLAKGARTDSKNGSDTETGTEEIELERRRHGNIGVTTSGQLIRDYRLTHDFNLVKIVADDICKEIFTGSWC